jgi:Nuclease-related domain
MAIRTAAQTGRVIRLRYAGRCGCGARLPAGNKACWDAGARTVTCLDCLNGDDAAVAAVPEGSAPGTVIPPHSGTPGGAAGREYQRRKTKRDAQTDALPFGLRKLARAVFDDPQHIRAWQSGERGEIAVAKVLSGLAADSITALHDRRIPNRRANIDHIVIGPAGIYVIDAKRYVGQRVEVRSFGGLFSPRRAELFVGGRRKTDLVNGLAPQVDAVREALSEVDVATGCVVQPVLCFVDAEWSWSSRNLSVDGVAVVRLPLLRRLVVQPGPLDAQSRHRLHGHLAQRLPQMT